MISEKILRCRLVTSLSLISGAFSVGLRPALGAHLVERNRQYPFFFVAGAAGACVLLVFFLLKEARRPELLLPCTNARVSQGNSKFGPIYRYVHIFGFSTYFMSMTASIAFFLSLICDS